LKSEESVHRKHKFYSYIKESNEFVRKVAEEYSREIGREIPMLDSYHITRSWDTSDDWIHYYKSNNKFFGNVASISVANQILVAFYNMMERNLKVAASPSL
jgi:predicted transcriptional regulator